MADIYWEVPLKVYPEVCAALWECYQLERTGDSTGASEMKEAIKRFPGYPYGRFNPSYDTIVVIPKGASITITKAALPGLPQPKRARQ